MRLMKKLDADRLVDLIQRTGLPCGALVPANRKEEEWLSKKKPSSLLVCEDHTPPSAKMRRLYWALLGKICKNHWFYSDKDVLNNVIKKELQYFDFIINHKLEQDAVLRPNNAIERNFEEYKEFVNKALDYITIEILPGVTKAEVIREIEEMMHPMTWKDAMRGNKGQDTGELYDEPEEPGARDDVTDKRRRRQQARKLAAEAQEHSDGGEA